MASVTVSSTMPAYFGNYPGVRRHGDWITVSASGTVVGSRWIRMTTGRRTRSELSPTSCSRFSRSETVGFLAKVVI